MHVWFPAMRFTKSDVLECFDREDRSYRLAIICSHWLQGGAQYEPSAAEEARSLQMGARGKWISFADVADMLEQQIPRTAITSDFVLNQLHALIRAPFELLSDYCEDYDKKAPARQLLTDLKNAAWYDVARLIRNAISHNYRFVFSDRDGRRMPLIWNRI